MTPTHIRDINYSVMREKAGSKKHSGLCSAVLLGPNASGKSNLIGAMETFKSIVLRGHIRNGHENKANAAACFLELIPNCRNEQNEPVSFSIKFLEEGILVEYGFTAEIGGFMDYEYHRRIIGEELKVNGAIVFSRGDALLFGTLSELFLKTSFIENKEAFLRAAKADLEEDEFFLTSGFKALISSKLASLISNWLDSKFLVVYSLDASSNKLVNLNGESIGPDDTLNELADLFGNSSTILGYRRKEEDESSKLVSIYKKSNGKLSFIDADLFESKGMIRFLEMAPLLIGALKYGKTLVVDELDASMHSSTISSIVNIFHNDDINIKHAQLIFSTHNPIFLNTFILRRDEIKFVDWNEETNESMHYSLTDIGNGNLKVHKNENAFKNYLDGQYGAIKFLNYSDVFERLMESEDE
jgi:AAA15 family ATPase/GTPase